MGHFSNMSTIEIDDLRNKIAQLEKEKCTLTTQLDDAQKQVDKLQFFFDATPDSVLLLDEWGGVVDCNASALQLLEYENKDRLKGKMLLDLIPGHLHGMLKSKIEALQGDSGCNVKTSLIKWGGIALTPEVSLLIRLGEVGFYTVIIQSISDEKQKDDEASKQIELLAKLAIVNYEIKQAQTCNELKQSLCHQCLLLTEANESWLLSNVSDNQFELISCNNQRNVIKQLKADQQLFHHAIEILNTPQDVYILERAAAIKPQGIFEGIDVELQYVIGAKLRSGNWTLLGLNYNKVAAAKNEGDLDFLRNIFSQVFSAFDNLITYEKLIENENRFRAIIEGSDNIVCVLNKDLIYTYVSPSVKNYLLYPTDLLAKRPGAFVHPDDLPLYMDAIQRAFLDSTQSVSIPVLRNCRRDGSIVYTSVDITNMMHVKGVEGVVVNLRDINQRVDYELKLKQSEEKFRNIFNLGNDPVYIADLQGNFLEVNDVAVTRTGFSREEFLKSNLQSFSTEISRDKASEFIAEIIREGTANAEESFVRKDGVRINFHITGKLIDYKDGHALLLRSIDITERKNIERQILDAVIKTEERERARFARELHDGIGPFLSAIKFFLHTLSREEDEETRKSINNKALESIDEIIKNIREISNNISPRVLNHFGIIPAINSVVKKLTDKQVQIIIKSNVEGVRFGENMEINIFRIFTELINNSLKHSKATQLQVSIMKDGNRLVAVYTDNGVGFNFDKKYAMGKGSGLYNIVNRVNSLNGQYEFVTAANNGLKFKAIFEI